MSDFKNHYFSVPTQFCYHFSIFILILWFHQVSAAQNKFIWFLPDLEANQPTSLPFHFLPCNEWVNGIHWTKESMASMSLTLWTTDSTATKILPSVNDRIDSSHGLWKTTSTHIVDLQTLKVYKPILVM